MDKKQIEFIEKANEKYNNKFDYSKVKYISLKKNITIICNEHGEFKQTPYHHIKSKFGCTKCSIKDSVINRTKDDNKFLDEIKERFGDVFDYSKVKYINSKTNVILICKKHNKEFNMIPNRLLNAKICCPDCVIDNKKTKNKKPFDKFIEEANKKHNYKFDYSKVEYVNSGTDIIIICPEHNEINTTPHQHLNSPTGCQKCSGKYKKNTDEFIEEAIKIHGDMYDYSNVNYINTHTNVIIYCKKHKINYEQTPSMHLNGSRCKTCADEIGSEKRRYTKDKFLNMAKETHQNNLDDYSVIDYINLKTKINIECIIHGVYSQFPIDHIGGHRCFKCGKDKLSLQFRLSREEFIKRSNEKHNNFYEYTNVEYVNADIKVEIICPKHGIFLQTPHNHMNGVSCKRCTLTGCSKVQIEWLKFLENELNLKIEHYENGGEHRIKKTKKNDADGYCKNINTIFEFQGCYYHGCKKCKPTGINPTCKKTYQELYDKTIKKKEHCIKEGYRYIEIWECEWTEIKKSDELLNNYINNLINIISITDNFITHDI
jgi:G:T-mismatch repair DNA endonuclease (very short patch repair protein)